MRILISFLTMMLAVTAVSAQSLDCSKFKTGKFTMFDSTTMSTIEITRTDKKQTEYHMLSGEKVTLKVEWTDDCTYVLIHKNKDYLPIEVRIVSITGNTYSFYAGPVGSTKSIAGTITKIE